MATFLFIILRHQISITGYTKLIRYDNLGELTENDLNYGEEQDWDLLEFSQAVEDFCYKLCKGEIPKNVEYLPYSLWNEDWGLTRQELRQRDYSCDEILPIQCVMPYRDNYYIAYAGYNDTDSGFVFGYHNNHIAIMRYHSP